MGIALAATEAVTQRHGLQSWIQAWDEKPTSAALQILKFYIRRGRNRLRVIRRKLDFKNMSWWETALDAVPVVGVAYRTGAAVTAHVTGDHEEAQRQWTEAGMNAAGDALGLVTGGAGKVATTAAKVGAKAVVKTAVKQGVKQAVKAGGRAAMKAASKQLTKSAMKAYAKKYFKKKVKKAAKRALKDAMDEYFGADYIDQYREKIIGILVNEAGVSQYDIQELDEQELLDLAYAAANYDDDY